MRDGYIIDTLTSVDIQKIVKNEGEVIEIYEGVVSQENSKISTFSKSCGNVVCFKTKRKRRT